MTRSVLVGMLVSSSLIVFGCKKPEKTEPAATDPKVQEAINKAGSAAGSAAAKAGSAAAQAVDKLGSAANAVTDAVGGAAKPALTMEAYEKLILGLEGCTLKGYDIDHTCEGAKALTEGKKNSSTSVKDVLGMNAKLGQKLIGHAAPAIRVKAASLLGSFTGTSNESQDLIVAAAAKETDPGVLQAFIRTVSNDGSKNPKVAELLVKSADHADVKVRLQAVYAISSPWNKDMAGGVEKLLAMAEKDADPKARQSAANYGGALGSKLFIPFYEKCTAKPAADKDKDMYAACMEGLVKSFHDFPLYGTTNEAAYKLFVKRLTDKPRSKDAPPWTVMSSFQYYSDDAKISKLVEWKKAATWFKADVVKKALTDVIADKTTNWMSRTGAVTSLLGLGATKAELEALKKGYDEKNNDDKMVIKKIDEAAAKAK